MPTFSGVSHISFSSRDAESSAKWWATLLDHMGFRVDQRAELDEWLHRFDRLGVTHSAIADREYGAVLTFKDPDGIQFDMFYKADHP